MSATRSDLRTGRAAPDASVPESLDSPLPDRATDEPVLPAGGGYRPHIDGIRALAVILVILFHLGYTWMPGGFIGVDVFFVLSGYLITGLLLREVTEHGRIRLANFYARRIRRLLAASALAIVAVLVLSAWLLDAVDQHAVGLDGQSAAAYFANWHFVADGRDYFVAGDVPSPLIHFWSLAVEEQFYVVWPALFLVLWRLSTWRRGRRATGGLLVAIAVLLGISAVLSVVLVPSTSAYYGAHTRAYQLLAGAALAVIAVRLRPRIPDTRAVRAVSAVVALAAFAAVVWLATAIPDAETYPGAAALAVTAAAFVLLAALDLTPRGRTQRAIGSPVPAAVGRMSYSLYLWHWPVIVFAPVLARKYNLAAPTWRWTQVAAIVLAAGISYLIVERPVRFRLARRAPALAVVAAGLLVSAAVAVAASPPWAGSDFRSKVLAAAQDVPYTPGCPYTLQQWSQTSAEACVLRRGRGPTIALVGDSHAQQWQPAFEAIARRHDATLLRLTFRGCPVNRILVNFYDAQGIAHPGTRCYAWRAQAYPRLIARWHPDLVYLQTRSHGLGIQAGRFVSPGSARYLRLWSSGWLPSLRTLTAGHRQVVVGETSPTMPFKPPACLLSKGPSRVRECDVPLSRDRAVVPFNRVIQGLPRRVPGVTVVSATPFICPDGTCPAILGGMVVHRDDDHLTATFARHSAPQFEDMLRRAGVRLP
ncbi:MAG: hypothetical protein QOI91_1187 [Solirubrobacteraceae bacterium]|jgi:peptidoglycan/LPS O-acetylase OafA/YrhL|nr:hypothetical protein [Solirubrobacteraceae bacterium]